MYHNDHRGGAQQFHYTVQTEDDYYCRLLFDGETLSWRFIEVKKEGSCQYESDIIQDGWESFLDGP